MTELNQEKLKELVNYDSLTGIFVNRITRSSVSKKGAIVGALKTNKRSGKSYLVTSIQGKKYYMHRLAFLYMTGSYPIQADHINGNGLDNAWVNLRGVCNQGNQRNRGRAKNNSSGVTGISWSKTRQKWEAQIMVNKKCKHLGRFDCFNTAVIARKAAEIENNFHPNHDKAKS